MLVSSIVVITGMIVLNATTTQLAKNKGDQSLIMLEVMVITRLLEWWLEWILYITTTQLAETKVTINHDGS